MATVSLIRPKTAPSGDLQNKFSDWANKTRGEITSGHTLRRDYQHCSAAPPSSLRADVAASDIVIFYGHGAWTTLIVLDSSGTEFVWAGSSAASPALCPSDFSGKIVVAIACQAGDTLADDLKTAGASGFLGYDDSLIIIDPATVSSTHFKDAVLAGASEILNGSSTTVAADKVKDLFKAAYVFFKKGAGRSDRNATFSRAYAAWDRSCVTKF
jgi:hypothetical protein